MQTEQRPVSSLSNRDILTPVAHLVAVEQVTEHMGGLLAVQYVPRSEFDTLSRKLDATNNDVIRVKDSIETVQQAATTTVLSQTHAIAGDEDLISIRSMVTEVKKVADKNATAISLLGSAPASTTGGNLEVRISDVAGRVDRLSVSDIEGMPDFSSFLTADDYAPAHSKLTELDTTSELHTEQLSTLTLKQREYASSSALNELKGEFREHVRTAVTQAKVDEVTERVAKQAVETLRLPQPTVDATVLADLVNPMLECKLQAHGAQTKAELAKQTDLIKTRASQEDVTRQFKAVAAQVGEAKKKSNEVISECKGVRASLAQVLGEVAKLKVNMSSTPSTSSAQEGTQGPDDRISKVEGTVKGLVEQIKLMPPTDVQHDLNIIWRFLKGLLMKDNPNWEREQQYCAPILKKGETELYLGSSILCERPTILAAQAEMDTSSPSPPLSSAPTPRRVTEEEGVNFAAMRDTAFATSLPREASPSFRDDLDMVRVGKRAHSGPSQEMEGADESDPTEVTQQLVLTGSPMLPVPPVLAPVAAPTVVVAATNPRKSARSTPQGSPLASPRRSPRGKAAIDYNEQKAHIAVASGKKPFQVPDLDTIEPNVTMPRVNMGRKGNALQDEISEGRREYASDAYHLENSVSHAEEGNFQMEYTEGEESSGNEATSDATSYGYPNDPEVERKMRITLGIKDHPLGYPQLSNKEGGPRARRDYAKVTDGPYAWSWDPKVPQRPLTDDTAAWLLQHQSKNSYYSAAEAAKIYGSPQRDEADIEAERAAEPVPRSANTEVAPEGSETPSEREEGPDHAALAVTRKKKNRNSKARKNKRKQAYDRLPMVNAELQPVIPREFIERFAGEEYSPTDQQKARRDTFFTRDSTLVSLAQEKDEMSLHIFAPDDIEFVTPKTVMVDTGAEIKVMMSPGIARALKLTWTPNSTKLVGVGGTGGGDGYAHQRVNLRLGAFNGHDKLGPFRGCFTVSMKPLIMTQQVVNDIGFQVILGQGFLRTCLASVDPLRERLEYSPAWLTHACAEFRCSVPCNMSKGPAKLLMAVLFSLNKSEGHEPMSAMIVSNEPAVGKISTAKRATRPATPRPATSPAPSESSKGGSVGADSAQEPVSASAESGHEASGSVTKKKKTRRNRRGKSKAARKGEQGSDTASDPEVTPEAVNRAVAGILHPGFGQSEIKSRQEFREQAAANSARRALDAAASNQVAVEARARESEKLAHVISPISVSYSVRDLQASARLMDGFKLDLTPNAGVSAAQLEAIAKRAAEIMRSGNDVARMPAVPRPPPAPSSTGATMGTTARSEAAEKLPRALEVRTPGPVVIEPLAVEQIIQPPSVAALDPATNPTPAEAAVQSGLRRSPRRVTMSQEAIEKDVSDEWRRQRGQSYPVRRTYQQSFSQIAAAQVAAESVGRTFRFKKKKVVHRAGSASNVRSKVGVVVAAVAAVAAALPTANAHSQSLEGVASTGNHAGDMTAYLLITVCVVAVVALNRAANRCFANRRLGGMYAIGVATMTLAASIAFGNAQALSVSWNVLQATGLGDAMVIAAVTAGMLAMVRINRQCTAFYKSALRE